MPMDERKFRILQAIIDDYILTAIPVGSRTISKRNRSNSEGIKPEKAEMIVA